MDFCLFKPFVISFIKEEKLYKRAAFPHQYATRKQKIQNLSEGLSPRTIRRVALVLQEAKAIKGSVRVRQESSGCRLRDAAENAKHAQNL